MIAVCSRPRPRLQLRLVLLCAPTAPPPPSYQRAVAALAQVPRVEALLLAQFGSQAPQIDEAALRAMSMQCEPRGAERDSLLP